MSSFFRSLAIQNGPRLQCAEPVTGSSLIPSRGANTRETISYPIDEARLVIIIARAGICASVFRLGRSERTVSSESTSTR
jgi:hypothetical protein